MFVATSKRLFFYDLLIIFLEANQSTISNMVHFLKNVI